MYCCSDDFNFPGLFSGQYYILQRPKRLSPQREKLTNQKGAHLFLLIYKVQRLGMILSILHKRWSRLHLYNDTPCICRSPFKPSKGRQTIILHVSFYFYFIFYLFIFNQLLGFSHCLSAICVCNALYTYVCAQTRYFLIGEFVFWRANWRVNFFIAAFMPNILVCAHCQDPFRPNFV